MDDVHHTWSNVLIHDDRDPANPLLMLAQQARVNPAGAGESLKLVLVDGTVHLANLASQSYSVVAFERGELAVGVGESIWRKNRFRSAKEELTPHELLVEAKAAEARGEDARPLYMAFHWRWGQALSPIAFALIGIALALGRSGGRGGRSSSRSSPTSATTSSRGCSRTSASRGRCRSSSPGSSRTSGFAGVGLLLLWRVTRSS